MANALKLAVVAEGVETADQLGFLKDRGCQLAQGYYNSHPLPSAEIEEFVRNREGGIFFIQLRR